INDECDDRTAASALVQLRQPQRRRPAGHRESLCLVRNGFAESAGVPRRCRRRRDRRARDCARGALRRPADAMHRFGHGKAESLAALIQALLLAGAASVLIFDGLHRLITPQAVAQLNVGLGVIAGSTLLTALLVLFESYVTKRTRSHAIAADRSHHLSDVAANLAVLLALALTKLTGWPRFDPLFAIAIA